MADDGRLGFWYRVRWALNYALLTVAGPAALGPGQDPRERMRRERAAEERRAAARAAQREAEGGPGRGRGRGGRRGR